MTSIHLLRPAFSVLLLLLLSFSAVSQGSNDLSNSFRRFDLVKIDTSSSRISFRAAGRQITLAIAWHDLRASAFTALDRNSAGDVALDRATAKTFKGSVVGESGSDVRLTIDGRRAEGFFTSHGERYFIEPADKYSRSAAPDDLVVYREADVIGDTSFECGATVVQKLDRGLAIADRQETPDTLRRFEVATEADYEYVSTLGGAAQANAEILSILNMAEGVYERELGITISVVFQHTWSTPDPFAGANPEMTVRNFQAYWNQNFSRAAFPRDTAHLFSAKANVQSQGWAFQGVVCETPDFAYGMSGYVEWAPAKYLLTAHEVAHNLGATHVDAPQGCANTLMNAQLTFLTPMSFCTYSQNEIAGYLGAHGSCLSPLAGCRFDFDGDVRADIGVFRPTSGVWYLNESTNGFAAAQFGQNGDKPVTADYDGDGRSDIAVYRGGVWYRLRSSTGTFDAIAFGLANDIPAPADFDGDGRADVAVFRPATGYWYQLRSTEGFAAVGHGTNGDVPIPADYDGDGKADVNVFRPSTGTWYRINSANGSFYGVQFGQTSDRGISGDFDGDARADIAVYRPANGTWYMLLADGSFRATSFGLSTDVPAPADFDGDGRTDVSVFRPATGIWYRLNSSNGSFAAVQFGVSTDLPVISYYIQ
jgi:hypothetical protein